MHKHISVLLPEVIEHLQPEPNHIVIDGTVGQGGHAEHLLERILPDGRLLGIDRDSTNLQIARKRLARFGDAFVSVHGSYVDIKTHAYAHKLTSVNAILLDIGFSSLHVDDPGRGFSFRADGPLDMRYDRSGGITAEEIVNEWSEDELARIFRVYGEEPLARSMAQAICQARSERITSTLHLASLIEAISPRRGKTHPATRVFQALRIAVNDELGQLERVLPQAVELLAPGGRLAIISFHSLEDRMVKQYFKGNKDLEVITKKPVVPSQEECRTNPRARSAKLRVAQKKN